MDEVNRLQPGDQAPGFTLPSATGEPVSLQGLHGSKRIVYFYPAAGTPGCTTEACDFRDNLGSLGAAGFRVLGISPDSPGRLAEWAGQEQLPYPLLADEDGQVHRRYGAWGAKTVGGEPRVGVLRSTFVIDEHGTIRHARYEVDAKGHVAELRALLGV